MVATLTISGGDVDDGQTDGGKQSELERRELKDLRLELQ